MIYKRYGNQSIWSVRRSRLNRVAPCNLKRPTEKPFLCCILKSGRTQMSGGHFSLQPLFFIILQGASLRMGKSVCFIYFFKFPHQFDFFFKTSIKPISILLHFFPNVHLFCKAISSKKIHFCMFFHKYMHLYICAFL